MVGHDSCLEKYFSSTPCISGDTLGSVVYVPCEVVKQRMQVQGTRNSWTQKIMKENSSRKPGERMYGYYSGMFQAGHSICKQHGIKGLFAGYYDSSLTFLIQI